MGDLIQSISIENLLNQRNAILERYQQMRALAKEINQLTAGLKTTYPPHFEWEYNGRRHDIVNRYHPEEDKGTEEYRQAIDGLAWELLMKESGNLSFMDAKAQEEWRKGLEKEVPALTPANIKATFQNLHEGREDMFNRGIVNVFKGLSWNYKTNSPFKFGKRIIVRYIYSYSSQGQEYLDDLYRAFHALDDQIVPEYRHGIRNQMNTAKQNHQDYIETPYFHLKWYGNGNGHVTFKRLDLVEKLNKIVATFFPFHIPQDNKQAA